MTHKIHWYTFFFIAILSHCQNMYSFNLDEENSGYVASLLYTTFNEGYLHKKISPEKYPTAACINNNIFTPATQAIMANGMLTALSKNKSHNKNTLYSHVSTNITIKVATTIITDNKISNWLKEKLSYTDSRLQHFIDNHNYIPTIIQNVIATLITNKLYPNL